LLSTILEKYKAFHVSQDYAGFGLIFIL